jgi:uncharacterized DUF497 family protein
VTSFDWNDEKNARLKRERGVSFEQVVIAVEQGRLLDVLEHQNRQRYGERKLLVVEIDGYAFLVPRVENETERLVFMKTIVPSRKATREYLGGGRLDGDPKSR